MGSAPVGVQCHLHHHFPYAAILRLPVECVDFFYVPFLDVVQLFSARLPLLISPSFINLLSFILHMCPNMFSFLSMICCTMSFLHHTLLAPLLAPLAFHSKSKSHLIKNSFLDSSGSLPDEPCSHLTWTSSYFSSDNNSSDWTWLMPCAKISCGVLEVWSLRLQFYFFTCSHLTRTSFLLHFGQLLCLIEADNSGRLTIVVDEPRIR